MIATYADRLRLLKKLYPYDLEDLLDHLDAAAKRGEQSLVINGLDVSTMEFLRKLAPQLGLDFDDFVDGEDEWRYAVVLSW